MDSLFPKLLKLSSAASSQSLEVFSKDTANYGQLPQKTNVNLKLYKTPEGFFYWTFDILEEKSVSVALFNTEGEETASKKASSKTKSALAQQEADTTAVEQASDETEQSTASTAASQKDLVIVVYNDTVISNFLAGAMTMSVIGVYVTIVYAVGRFLRIIFDRYSQRILYEELPNTEKLFEICEGIFIA